MATATTTRKAQATQATHATTHEPRKAPATPRGTCSATIRINATAYTLKPVRCDRSAARRCFELRKSDGTVYHVASLSHGAECDCADFVFHRDGKDPLGCKHIKALGALGILDTRPAPVRTPPPSAWGDDVDMP